MKYDKEIMQKLLQEPSVKKSVDEMTTKELKYFKRLLVQQGTYQRYVLELQAKEIKALTNPLRVSFGKLGDSLGRFIGRTVGGE